MKSEHSVKSIQAIFGIVDGKGKPIGRFPLERKKIVASGLRRYSNSFVDRWQKNDDENSAKFDIACMADEYIKGATVYLHVIYHSDARKSFGERIRFSDAKAAPRKQTKKTD